MSLLSQIFYLCSSVRTDNQQVLMNYSLVYILHLKLFVCILHLALIFNLKSSKRKNADQEIKLVNKANLKPSTFSTKYMEKKDKKVGEKNASEKQ